MASSNNNAQRAEVWGRRLCLCESLQLKCLAHETKSLSFVFDFICAVHVSSCCCVYILTCSWPFLFYSLLVQSTSYDTVFGYSYVASPKSAHEHHTVVSHYVPSFFLRVCPNHTTCKHYPIWFHNALLQITHTRNQLPLRRIGEDTPTEYAIFAVKKLALDLGCMYIYQSVDNI